MKTLEDLLGDRDARAAVETLIAREFGPELIAAAVAYLSATGLRRSGERVSAEDYVGYATARAFRGGDA